MDLIAIQRGGGILQLLQTLPTVAVIRFGCISHWMMHTYHTNLATWIYGIPSSVSLFYRNMQERESHFLLISQLPLWQCVKTTRLYLPDWLDPDRDSLFIVSEFAFVLCALYAVSKCEYKHICCIQGVKVKYEKKNGSIRIFEHWLFTTLHSPTQIWLLNTEWKDFSDSCDCRSLLESFDLHLCLDPAKFSIVDSEHLKILAWNATCHF